VISRQLAEQAGSRARRAALAQDVGQSHQVSQLSLAGLPRAPSFGQLAEHDLGRAPHVQSVDGHRQPRLVGERRGARVGVHAPDAFEQLRIALLEGTIEETLGALFEGLVALALTRGEARPDPIRRPHAGQDGAQAGVGELREDGVQVGELLGAGGPARGKTGALDQYPQADGVLGESGSTLGFRAHHGHDSVGQLSVLVRRDVEEQGQVAALLEQEVETFRMGTRVASAQECLLLEQGVAQILPIRGQGACSLEQLDGARAPCEVAHDAGFGALHLV
jgi:hypothetical protein